ncbi:hypothetical protein ABE073_04660 [Lederbergia citrisecunda]|uniref:hypothetical protein n=1 Tax=Lederbergia citrisecunda TaxID=2833583 RepID=UPI003D2B7877
MVNPEMWKLFKKAKANPAGFKCWDCGDVIEGLNLEDDHFEVAPIDMDGYKMLICKKCCENE